MKPDPLPPVVVRRVLAPPANAAAFFEETAEGIRGLYGPAAEQHYRENAAAGLRVTLAHPSVHAFGAYDGPDLCALLLVMHTPPVAHLSYIHVLRGYQGLHIEQHLLEAALLQFQTVDTEHILAEFMPFAELELERMFLNHGFEPVKRRLMRAALDAPALTVPDPRALLLTRELWPAAAECLAAAYHNDPGRRLHYEVSAAAPALRLLSNVAAGQFGPFRPGYAQALLDGGRCGGVVLGCEAAPDTGFVLQLAVRPELRGRGLGARLMRSLAASFRESGLRNVALGVTSANPALRLYERLGFEPVRAITAYTWWRNPPA